MSKNFWKMTTIGLVGYIVGTERFRYKPTPYGQFNHKKTFREQIGEILINKAKYLFYGTIPSTRTYQNILKTKDIVFDSKDSACIVLDKLKDEIECYGKLNLRRLCEICCVSLSKDRVEEAEKYGWRDLSSAFAYLQTNGTWTIHFPEVMRLTVNYSSIKPSFNMYSQRHNSIELSDIMYETYQDAADVLDALKTDIDECNAASMEDAYIYSGYSAPAGSYKKGWTSLDEVTIRERHENNKVYWTINWPPVEEFEEEE